ncbi:MAG TPA: type II toxin-antitoxin system prevent-host-death family antitoxin [Candidatus Acidoferrum sp.]|jgi:prevent-host-death family protein|nr:type II toxin-antitoxin system prevent-host-death family antitoxin [Candidatus Acidoferrum sp.]
MEKTVSAADANRKFSELLRGVRKGLSYIVTSHGKPVARLVPADSDSSNAEAARSALLKRLASQKLPKGANPRNRWTREELYEDAE